VGSLSYLRDLVVQRGASARDERDMRSLPGELFGDRRADPH
jgi:hypothetical protein